MAGNGGFNRGIALLAFEALEQRRLLAADVGAGAVMHDDVEIEAVDVVLADESGFIGLRDGGLEPLALANEFAANVDVTGGRAHGAAGDQAALDEKMRIVPHDLAVLAGAWLRLVGVDDEVARPAVGLLGHERPFEAGRESGAAAAALAGRLHFVDDGVAAFFQNRLGAVPGAACARAVEAPVVPAVEIAKNAVPVGEHYWASRIGCVGVCLVERWIGQRVLAADRRGELTIDLRSRLRLFPGGQIIEDAGQRFRREVLVIVGIDLNHRRIHARAQALDLGPRERAVGGDVVFLADHAVQDLLQPIGAAQHARRRAAKLHVETSDRREIEHRVEGRDFEHADLGHAEHLRHRLDRLLRQPAAGLLLRPPQDRDHR